jgi:carbon monoxide dehydrogenase subunit G
MEFSRSLELDAPFGEVWSLVNDVPLVAACIPGVKQVEMVGPREFTCTLTQHVGSAKANFALRSTLEVDEDARVVTALSDGRDRALGSSVKAKQRFALEAAGDDRTKVDITADVQITGRIATFGHRIIAAKAEQVTVEAVENVQRMLESRRAPQA